MDSAAKEPVPPHLGRVGAYETLAEIASGGMATVFLARAVDGREGPPLVAIKRPHRHLASDKTFVSMLIDEARLASSIDHPNVVRVRELGFEGGVPFIVMDYVEGTSLADMRSQLAEAGRVMDTRVALRIILDALAGLHAAHELRDETGRHLGIVHRDVSPHNVLIGCDGFSKLTDFGIAKAEDRVQVTRTHEVKGKLAYLAPERIDKRRICTVQSDVFSMAVVLWECLAGRRLFRGEAAVETLQEVLSAPIPALRDLGAQVPPALDGVIARALSRDLDTRHPTALEFAGAIERAAGPELIGQRTDVARLMEALFSDKMAERHQLVRETIGDAPVDELLRLSGLPIRDRQSFEMNALDDLAPRAPSVPYSFGQVSPILDRLQKKRIPWWAIAGTIFGVAAGALLTIALTSHPPTPMHVAMAPSKFGSPASSSAVQRRVVVPLPFLAALVTFDEIERTMDPPSEVVAFDIPKVSGIRHRVTAISLDGSRAEGYVREEDGVARAEGDGYAFTFSSPVPERTPPASAPVKAMPAKRPARGAPPAVSSAPAPANPPSIGTKKDGFTRLK